MPPGVANERAKLTATYLNNVAVALFAIGALTPFASTVQAQALPDPVIGLFAFGCMGGSIGLHLAARNFLRRLVP